MVVANAGTVASAADFVVVGMVSEAVAAMVGTVASRGGAAVEALAAAEVVVSAVAAVAVAVAADNDAAGLPDGKIEAGRAWRGATGCAPLPFWSARRVTPSAARVAGKLLGLIGPVASRKAATGRLLSADR